MKFGNHRSSCGSFSSLLVILCICLLYNWISPQLEAKETVSTATSSFLRISVDARGAAMGDAQGAATEDVYATYWNPAGLARVSFRELGITYQRVFQGLNYSFLGYAAPTDSYGTFAGQIMFFSSGPITATYESLDGSFAGVGDSFSVADLALGLSQSKAITEGFSYGLSLKLLSHKIMDQNAFSLALDAGLLYQTLIEELRLGVALQNFSTSYHFLEQQLREPWNLRFAALYTLPEQPLFLTVDYNLISGQQDTLNLGAEYWFLDLVAIRAGMKLPEPSDLLSSLSMGLGVNFRDIYQLDYSLSPHSELGISQRFTMTVRF